MNEINNKMIEIKQSNCSDENELKEMFSSKTENNVEF